MPKTYKCYINGEVRDLTTDEICIIAQRNARSILKRAYSTFFEYHEDMAQTAILTLLMSMDRYDYLRGSIYAYCAVIVSNAISDEAKKIKAHNASQLALIESNEDYIMVSAVPAPEIVSEELLDRIARLRKMLTATERKAFDFKRDGHSSSYIHKQLFPDSKSQQPGQSIHKIIKSIALKAKKIGLDKWHEL